MNEAAAQNWSSRALERQIGTLYCERLLLSDDRQALAAEADANLQALKQAPREFIRDPVMLELGKGFAFVARQQRISPGTGLA